MTLDSPTLRARKDTFVSALFALSKASQEASNAAINFVSALDNGAATASELAALGSIAASFIAHASVANADAKGPASAGSNSDDKKRKKRERKTDPDAPKRPLPAFLVFSNEQKKQIRAEREKGGQPALAMTELNAIVQERWKALDGEAREKFDKEYNARIEEFNKQRDEYRAQHKDDKVDGPAVKSPELEMATALVAEETKKEDKKEDKKDKEAETKKEDKEKKTDGQPEKKKRKRKEKKEKEEA